MKRLRKMVFWAVPVLLAFVVAGTFGAIAMDKVNINTATPEELATLDRIGPKYAQRIIEYRETVSPFETPEDIMKVKGIGKKTFEANKDRIVVK
jgi:competence protein ComEA